MTPMKLYFAFVRSGSGGGPGPQVVPGAEPAHPCRFVHWCALVLEQEGAVHKAVPTKLGA